MSKEAIERAVARYFAALCGGNENEWLDVFSEDVVTRDPVGSPPNEGMSGLRAVFQRIGAAFARLDLAPDRIYVSGNGAAVNWSGKVVGKNGCEIAIEGIDVFEMDSAGKI